MPALKTARFASTAQFSNISDNKRQRRIAINVEPDASSTGTNSDSDSDTDTDTSVSPDPSPEIQTHLAEGLCAVYKPLEWSSNDVVMYIRGMLERDARGRGIKLPKRRSKSKKKVKVGHGGTLDPLATGVLVLGIGSGTKKLQEYLKGSKKYRAGVELGFETATLDMEGGREHVMANATKTGPTEHVTEDMIITDVIPQFTGDIMQKPPIYSAIRKNGKRLYEQARAGMTEDDIEIELREVSIHSLEYLSTDDNGKGLPCFGLDVECGGGTYIRSLVRDMGYALDTCATMTSLERTKQGQFGLDDALAKDDWSSENIYAAVERSNANLAALAEKEKEEE
eukprot:CAMPEP_0194090492 /NCGR_PEP_ID=MMETSP0149-20130528/39244_1 /TAXON_ID=122233 /ORGANISM="Chaetoceros debilis, Strain MM31A-1" /LENGTH=338 /DNA_ID=CAMNT_0038774761 /DNA_START=74 /DNA_END=1090 /DNA_ORIENTATION=+